MFVSTLVRFQTAVQTKGSATHPTCVWFYATVSALMHEKVALVSESFVAQFARERSLTGVTAFVNHQTVAGRKRLEADLADVRPIGVVGATLRRRRRVVPASARETRV